MTDPIESLARYAPSAATVDTEWSRRTSQSVLNGIIGSDPTSSRETPHGDTIALHFVPARRERVPRRTAVALAASVAAIAVGGGALVTLLPGGDSPRTAPGGGAPTPSASTSSAFTPPADLSDTALPEGKYAYTVSQAFDVTAAGTVAQDEGIRRSWLDAAGNLTEYSDGDGCQKFPRSGRPAFGSGSVTYYERIPSGIDALQTYLDDHVTGSTSRSEAVFVAVQDILRDNDQLASPKLRAAMLAVLDRTSGVTVHLNASDYLGRDAIRADFVDPANRGNAVNSLYLDPTDFHFLEERTGTNGAPKPAAVPSPAYTAEVADAPDPDELPNPASISVNRSETVVDSIPAQFTHDCVVDNS